MPTVAIAILSAALAILVPVAVACNLYLRARNHGRLPSPAAQATIAFALAAAGHNGLLVHRVVTGSDGVSAAGIVLALWSPLAAVAMWIALGKHRVRLYRSPRGAASLPVAAPVVPEPVARGAAVVLSVAPPALPAGLAAGLAIARRADPAPDLPCAAPIRAARLPPTIRDLVRADGGARLVDVGGAPMARDGTGMAAGTPFGTWAITSGQRFPARAIAEAARIARPSMAIPMAALPVFPAVWPPPLPDAWSGAAPTTAGTDVARPPRVPADAAPQGRGPERGDIVHAGQMQAGALT